MSQGLSGALAGLATALVASLGIPFGLRLGFRLYRYRAPADAAALRKWKRKMYVAGIVGGAAVACSLGLAMGITIALN